MNLTENFSYYLIITTLTFLVSLILAIKVMLSKAELTFYSKIKDRLIWAPITIYFIVFSSLAILKYNAYNMAMLDLGRMDQVIWNTLHGRFLACTLEIGNVCRLIAHTELIYVLIAPLYLIYSSPITLLILQSLVISLGALPVYWLAKSKLGGKFSPFCFALAYLLYPSLQYGNLFDFHADMLATVFLLFTFYYLECKNWFKYFVFLLLSLICKEYVSLIVIMLGIHIFITQRNIKFTSITFFLGIFWFLMAYKLIPASLGVNSKEVRMGLENLTSLGTSMGGIFKTVILHPMNTISRMITFQKLATIVLLFLPVGFLPLLDLGTLFISLPIFIGLILTSHFFSYTNHHNGLIIPFIFISSIGAGQYLIKKFQLKFRNITFAVGVFVFSTSLLSNIFYGPSPLSWRFWNAKSYRYWGNLHQFQVTEHDKIADKFIKMIPPNASVSASNHLGAHLSQRETIYHFPFPKNFNDIDFILIDLLEYFYPDPKFRQDEISCLRGLLSSNNFTLIACEDGILLLKKGLKKYVPYNLKVDKVKEAFPSKPINLSFDGRLLLIGYDLNDKYFETGKIYHIVYYWQVLKDFNKAFSYTYFGSVENLNMEYILIDTFENLNNKFRAVHLPAYILYTPANWKAGDILKEEFDFYVPQNIHAGNYRWGIGLYAVPRLFFIETEDRNLVPGTQEISLKVIQVKR